MADDDSPLLTPEAPGESAPTSAPSRGSRATAANGNGLSHGKRERDPEPERNPAPIRSDSSYLGGFGATPSAEKYRKIEKVGVGAYGSVFKAENTETKEIVAIKAASKKEDPVYGGFPLSLLREISILRGIKHENIVQMYEIAHTPQGDPLIVMEFCQASLLELIHSKKHELSFSEVKYIIRQVIDATDHMHQRGILHRDLATKNVLFNSCGEIKVCDFGISRVAFGQDEELGFCPAKGLENPNMIVSLPYRAIELLLGDAKYGPALDVWSCGCILAEILLCQTGRRQPFFGGNIDNPNKTPQAYVEEIYTICGKPTDETWPGLCKLSLVKGFLNSKVEKMKAHREEGDERLFLRKFFRQGDGKPADSKYCLTESFFDLLGSLLTLCPAQRITAAGALQHAFFMKEKPVPEWHAWHWALASSDIPRGDDMRKKGGDDDDDAEAKAKKLLKQLSKDEGGFDDAAGGEGGKAKSVLDKWKAEADKRQQAEQKAKAEKDKKAKAAADEKLPPGWTKHWSSSKQRFYYHDKASGKNSWTAPTK
eukprot:TRINITY_DN3618_c0_g4_i1.p1 TRINITY_DN3618_c0_g4~~TRINITY_DN3618_c0_g4_i1.p1  ORF type:complete len:539 (+),score=126.39 TRINITY_DN3618_c0_g4_i1:164-1780(+)